MWLVILFPATAVIAGLFTLNLAISSHDDLVVDDYYKQGIQINRTLARDKAAARYGLQVTLQMDTDRQLIYLYLTSTQANFRKPDQLQLNFRHRIHASLDSAVVLQRVADTLYQGALPKLARGHWDLEVATPDWRLVKSIQMPLAVKEIKITPVL